VAEPRRNIELKAVDSTPGRSLATCESLGAKDRGVLRQRDTYFQARRGRLKLREEEGAAAQLIAYERADLADHRTSQYRLIDIAKPQELREALATTLGVKAVITKERRLFLWEENVRIHLDAVEGLGSFIEFEAVALASSDLKSEEAQLMRLREAFEIDAADVIGESYCDIALANARGARLAERVFERAHLSGEFRLRSGALSEEYFDKYLFESDPDLLCEVATALAALLPDDIEAIAGLELGGVPLATMVSQISQLPSLFVRKQPKDYGTCRLAEGGEVAGRRVVVIEDVVTSGGQLIESCAALRERGAEIAAVICVIDREAGGKENLAAQGLELRSVFTMQQLQRAGA
jgi:orotate phosphoribosyltransferase